MKERNTIGERAAGGLESRFDVTAIADEDDRERGVFGNSVHGPSDDWTRSVIAAHRVEGDSHGLLPLTFFDRHDFAFLIDAAIRADAVGQHRLIALRAVLDLNGIAVVMTPPLISSGTGNASLRYGHVVRLVRSLNTKEKLC
jgi:hypothetical protein